MTRWPLGSLLFTAVLLLAPSLAANAEERPVHGVLEEEQGQRILYLWGTPQQRGYAEGYLMARPILDLIAGFCLHPKVLPDPRLWDQWVVPTVKARVEVRDSTRARYAAMLRGIREKLPPEERIVEPLGRELELIDLVASLAQPDAGGFACSSFVAYHELLEDGEGPLVGRNLDYMSTEHSLGEQLIKVEAPREGARGWVSLGYPGLLGCLTGFSDAGVSLAIHDVPARAKKGVKVRPRIDALGEVIETLEPCDDPSLRAAEIFRAQAYGFGANAMLAWNFDGETGAAVLEIDTDFTKDHGVSVRSAEDYPFVVCSNHHRMRTEAIECNRFQALYDGCELTANLEADPLDFESGWNLIDRASVKATIYRCVYDVETGDLRFQPREADGNMGTAVDLNVGALLAKANELAAEAELAGSR